VLAAVVRGTAGVWNAYVDLRGARQESQRLAARVQELEQDLQLRRQQAEEAARLRELLGLKQIMPVQSLVAQVIAREGTPWYRTVTIDKGSTDRLAADMAVISPAGVVGRVITPSLRAAKVQLLIDRNAAVAGLVERSRAQGVVVGTGENRLEMEYVPGTADIRVGDRVVTSGIDGIYPKGFLIGQIESVRRGAGDYTSVVVKPAVELSALEAVLVVSTPPESKAEGQE
jgi:rod shape-determining protein MreC